MKAQAKQVNGLKVKLTEANKMIQKLKQDVEQAEHSSSYWATAATLSRNAHKATKADMLKSRNRANLTIAELREEIATLNSGIQGDIVELRVLRSKVAHLSSDNGVLEAENTRNIKDLQNLHGLIEALKDTKQKLLVWSVVGPALGVALGILIASFGG